MTSILIKTFQGKIYFATLFSRIEHKTILSFKFGGNYHIYYVGTATIMP